MATLSEAFAIALSHQQAGRLQAAEEIYRRILAVEPKHAAATHLLGVIALQSGRPREAVETIGRAIELNGTEGIFHNNLGNAFKVQGQVDAAIGCYRRALQLAPNYADACVNLGMALIDRGQLEQAAGYFRRALEIDPGFPEALQGLGQVSKALGRMADAADCYRRVVELRPQDAEACFNLARACQLLARFYEAVVWYRRTLELRPDYPEAIHNLGHAFKMLGKMDDAAECYRRTVDLQPDNLSALSSLTHARQQACDWDNLSDLARRVVTLVDATDENSVATPAPPFFFLALPTPTTAEQQLRCARQWVARLPPLAAPIARPVRRAPRSAARSKITIGYLSSDFHAHATAFLIAELLERHDRDRFAVYGYSFGPDDRSPMRQRLIQGLDRFVDVTDDSPEATARRMMADEVDILVDLKGYTQGARTSVLMLRPAPIQVNYLGYPGTMGADFVDYLLVDDFIVSENQRDCFTEKLVHLPGCYQVNDSRRAISPHTPTRAECGLPSAGFVFCSFNNNYKITPEVFGVWMNLLKAVPGSVLWLWESNRYAPVNLRKHAGAHGVSAERLVFAPRLPLADHLARLRLADLFLDTFPVNAHTTASDALWAGCPVLTIAGETFVSRVAGSLLHSLGLPDLVATSLDAYAKLALQLANDPRRLADLRARLATGRASSALFDGGRFARTLEEAYLQMWELHAAGEKPRAFRVVD